MVGMFFLLLLQNGRSNALVIVLHSTYINNESGGLYFVD